MEQIPSNTPIMESKPGIAGWFQTWVKALTKPGEQTFIDIIASPDATSKTAMIWVFIAGTLSGLVQAVLQAIYTAIGVTPQIPIPGLEQYMQQPEAGGGIAAAVTSLITGICGAPIAGLFSVLFFAIGVAIIQWIAKLFGGTGSFDKLAYAIAAISVPFTVVSMVFSVFSAIPYVNICTGLISLLISFYAIYQQIAATKAVNNFGWGQAAGSVLIPGFAVLTLCACVVFGAMMILGPVIGQTFQSIAP